jgi:hypothetical protein
LCSTKPNIPIEVNNPKGDNIFLVMMDPLVTWSKVIMWTPEDASLYAIIKARPVG